MKKEFVFLFWFVGWENVSLGIHFNICIPNMEVHLPFGFIKIGWREKPTSINWNNVKWREFRLI